MKNEASFILFLVNCRWLNLPSAPVGCFEINIIVDTHCPVFSSPAIEVSVNNNIPFTICGGLNNKTQCQNQSVNVVIKIVNKFIWENCFTERMQK
jgi:hypothetical protein